MGITKHFKDFYGCTASISINLTVGGCTLSVYDAHGNLFHRKKYYSERGARIALGKFSDGTMKPVPVSEILK